MFRYLIVSSLLFAAVVVRGSPQAIEVVARKCAKAVIEEDYQTIADCTHHRIIESAGGREAFVALTAKAMRGMRTLGVTISDAQTGIPGEEIHVGSWLVSLVPQKVVIKGEKGVLAMESFLVAIAEQDGGPWALVDMGSMPEDERFILYPELKGKIVIPEKKQPVFTKNSKEATLPTTTADTPAAALPSRQP